MRVGSVRICDTLVDVPTGKLVGQKLPKCCEVSEKPFTLFRWRFGSRGGQVSSHSDLQCWVYRVLYIAIPIAFNCSDDAAVCGKQSQVRIPLCKVNSLWRVCAITVHHRETRRI